MSEAVNNAIRRDMKKKRVRDLSSLVTNPTVGYGGYAAGKKTFDILSGKLLEKYNDKTPKMNTGYETIDKPINEDVETLKGKALDLGRGVSG